MNPATGGHAGLLIDNPQSSSGLSRYEFAPKSGGWNDFDINVVYGPSETSDGKWPLTTVPNLYTRIPATHAQDQRALRMAKSAKNANMPYCAPFNNCAHMARLIINGAGIPLGNKVFDTPKKLQNDINNYLEELGK